MSQFAFLSDSRLGFFAEPAGRAEKLALADPRGAGTAARLAVEAMVDWLYTYEKSLREPYERHLAALIAEPTFRTLTGPAIHAKITLVRKIGNRAAHVGRFSDGEAVTALRELFHIGYWLASHYAKETPPPGLTFSTDKLPKTMIVNRTTLDMAVEKVKEADALRKEIAARDEERKKDAAARAAMEDEIARLQKEIAEQRKANEKHLPQHDYNEAQTRDAFIDLLLNEAGWPLDQARDREYPVTGMPNEQGEGFVDYVLWGDDGKPLGLVEAKRTKKSPLEGKRQAELYADCLETMTGQRPVIFYTNGYEHWIWDDQRHPPREVQGFLTKDELALAIQRRASLTPLAQVKTNRAIAGGAGRTYQELAIRKVAEAFERPEEKGENRREALLVMATGSGKTRTVIALVDVLMRANWAKRILFLADRTALVNQAANAFKQHLPDAGAVNLVTERKGEGRVYVSTYPTMMGLIDRDMDGAKRRFGPGFFDLVIIDEAHRSVYRKYKAIFDWFDSYLVGLTATPKDEVDKNTYELFHLERGVPTFSYDLEDAVRQGFLTPPRALDVPMKFPRGGIKYDELSDEEKEEWDALDWGEDGPPDEIDSSAVNEWLFNADTIDKMLEQLIRDGAKVDDGDKLGKTIIFAKNSKHADFIVERFDKNYPHYKGKFCQKVDYSVKYAQSLIDAFSEAEKLPQIAVSVDMLDTSIDIPEIVNLVFFKIVRSKSKFWQMIGRGTRLRPDLFGPGQDKECFFVFDYLGNFEFFNAELAAADGAAAKPLGERLFNARVELIGVLQGETEAGDGFEESSDDFEGETPDLLTSVRSHLYDEISAMPLDNFIVRSKRRWVEKFQKPAAWKRLSSDDQHELVEHVSGLPTAIVDPDIDARRFDLLCLQLQLGILRHDHIDTLKKRFMDLMRGLEEKESIPAVRKEMALIQDARTEEYWQDITAGMVEHARRRLRGLIKLIEKGQRKTLTTNFIDQMGVVSEIEIRNLGDAAAFAQYRRKAEAFLKQHKDHIALAKLRKAQPLTPTDLEEIERMFLSEGIGDQSFVDSLKDADGGLPAFIRSIVGLDRTAAHQALNDALGDIVLSPNQIAFLERIIDHLTEKGRMDPALLYEPPYTDESPSGIAGVFELKQSQAIIRAINDLAPRVAS